MLRPFALSIALACSMAATAASEIHPTHSKAGRQGTLAQWWLTDPDRHAMCAADMGNIRAAIDRLLAEAP